MFLSVVDTLSSICSVCVYPRHDLDLLFQAVTLFLQQEGLHLSLCLWSFLPTHFNLPQSNMADVLSPSL